MSVPVQPCFTPVQVRTDHYGPANYDALHRWVSYWYQMQAIARCRPSNVLEIGIGSGILNSYLRDRLGLAVTTVDFDESLHPDRVGDVRELDSIVDQNSFDVVVAFQVLEHLPFSDFIPALRQLANASRGSVILSLPHYGYDCQIRLRFWKWRWAFARKISKNPAWSFDGEHYWEIGTRGHSLARVTQATASVLQIERQYFCPDYPYHYFLECRKT